MSQVLYTALLGATVVERLVEMLVSRRNAAWSVARGGREFGRGHFPAMVSLHAGFLVSCGAEVWLADRVFVPWLGWPMLAIALSCQALRWWVIRTLGPRWNTRVIVVPGLPRVTAGPFRWLRHPNYAAVVTEGVALPLVHSAYVSALVFSLLDAALLRARVRVEDEALGWMEQQPGGTT